MKIPKPSTSSVLRWQAWQWKGYESHGSGWYYQPGAVEKRRRKKKKVYLEKKKTENKEICLYKLPQILQRCDSGLCTPQNSSPVHHHHGSDGCNDADFSGRVLLCFCAAVLTGHALSSSAGVQQVQRGTGELEHACFFPHFCNLSPNRRIRAFAEVCKLWMSGSALTLLHESNMTCCFSFWRTVQCLLSSFFLLLQSAPTPPKTHTDTCARSRAQWPALPCRL